MVGGGCVEIPQRAGHYIIPNVSYTQRVSALPPKEHLMSDPEGNAIKIGEGLHMADFLSSDLWSTTLAQVSSEKSSL